MSDPVTNVEIEDVLSSIRRLVSEDSREDPASDAREAARSAPTGRLVLTPALRVQDAAPRSQEPATPEHDAPAAHAAPFPTRLVPSEEERAEAERNHPAAGRAAEVEEVEEAPFIEVDDSAEEQVTEATIADFFSLKLREVPPASPPTARNAQDESEPKEGSLAQKIAELEEMIARSTHEFESETGEEAPAAIFRHQPIAKDAEDLDVPAADASGAEPAAAEAPVTVTSAPAPADEAALDEAPSAATPVVLPEDEDPELAGRPMPEPELVDEPFIFGSSPDRVQDEVAAETDASAPLADLNEPEAAAQETLEAVDPEPAPARRPVKILRNPVWQRSQSNLRNDTPEERRPLRDAPVADEQAPNDAVLGDALPTGLDEARLRQLVAEVVREELQGALGERVTRNVRKLVRRELQRILASEELD
ncbi:hypothetical protein [Alloyangia pacifica]|uniref:DUF2497 domain-containing protein n=1 Tax=Alloyangia pacifica TaxID=311180 RepID=A0A1I6NRN9_9RHOB|nr:hypothetical protein [Alloyangia pacifica]SDH63993.1 hypothetical protein SAMN04488245_108285 [Alloyangia pacifica]SFS30656.1 hypothetical protein SAMN04488050_10118 [Alloyangia pacifica]